MRTWTSTRIGSDDGPYELPTVIHRNPIPARLQDPPEGQPGQVCYFSFYLIAGGAFHSTACVDLPSIINNAILLGTEVSDSESGRLRSLRSHFGVYAPFDKPAQRGDNVEGPWE